MISPFFYSSGIPCLYGYFPKGIPKILSESLSNFCATFNIVRTHVHVSQMFKSSKSSIVHSASLCRSKGRDTFANKKNKLTKLKASIKLLFAPSRVYLICSEASKASFDASKASFDASKAPFDASKHLYAI